MKLTLQEWLSENGYSSAQEALEEFSEMDDTYPAMCPEGCEVEPDGHCPHGGPSLLLAMGLI